MEFIQQNIYLVIIAAVSGGMLLYHSFNKTGTRGGVTHAQATLLINRENAEVIDIREPDEYTAGHLPESRNIPASRIDERIGELEKFKDAPLILVCQTGARTAAVMKRLEKLGFSKLHALDGGIKGWGEAGLPLKRGAKK